jgi:superfamily II DNA or RNA helicase
MDEHWRRCVWYKAGGVNIVAGFVSEERLAYGPWQAIERMVARLIEHSGFKDVTIVGGTGDGGADVVGTFKGKRWVIQAKYRQSGAMNSSAGKEVVRSLSLYKADVAVAVTNQRFSQGAFDYQEEMKANGIDLRLWTGAYLLNEYYKPLPNISKSHKKLRTYQMEAVDFIEHKRSRGKTNALAIIATGLGKSLIANQLVVNELARNPSQEILVLAHTRPLVRQLEISSWSQLDKTVSTHLWTDGETPRYSGGIIFATWQSIKSALQREPIIGRFGLVIVDEAHHAPSIEFSKMLDALQPNFLVGLTATPWRGDERSLSHLFGSDPFTMDIVDGMQRGFLADVDYRMLTDGIDWDEIALMSKKGLTIRDLNMKLILPDRDLAIVEMFSDHFKSLERPRALIFCKSKSHTNRLRPLLSALGIKVAVLHSGLSREQQFHNLSAFRAGQIDCLLSVEMLNEGIDVPDVNLVAFMRVTHSRRIFIQQLGRGLRVKPGKSKVLVLDFVADIRRVAAGLRLNQEAIERGSDPEVIRFKDGRIVKFDNDIPATFFDEYLADVADIENMDEGARLKFPD